MTRWVGRELTQPRTPCWAAHRARPACLPSDAHHRRRTKMPSQCGDSTAAALQQQQQRRYIATQWRHGTARRNAAAARHRWQHSAQCNTGTSACGTGNASHEAALRHTACTWYHVVYDVADLDSVCDPTDEIEHSADKQHEDQRPAPLLIGERERPTMPP